MSTQRTVGLRFGQSQELTAGMKVRVLYDLTTEDDSDPGWGQWQGVNRIVSGEWQALKDRILAALGGSRSVRITDVEAVDTSGFTVDQLWIDAVAVEPVVVDQVFPDVWQVQDQARKLEPVTLIMAGVEIAGVGEALPADPNTFVAGASRLVGSAFDMTETAVEQTTQAVGTGIGNVVGGTARGITDSLSYGQRLVMFTAVLAVVAAAVWVGSEKLGVV